MATRQDTLHAIFVTGLHNAHAVERQALATMTPQVARFEHYPEVAHRLRLHIDETHVQVQRLDELLEMFGASRARLEDVDSSLSGGPAALAHGVAGDEILKDSFANYAFEHFEIAVYKTLLVQAADGGFAEATPRLRQSLHEEQGMAEWIARTLPAVARRHASLRAGQGVGAARA